MNIFWREFKTYRGSMFYWTSSLCILVFVFLLIYPSFASDVSAFQKYIANLPAGIRTALDISVKNFFTINGFYAYLFSFITLAGAVQAMNMGVGMLSREESGKTVDFLLTKPVSRKSVITKKLTATVSILVITNIIFTSIALVTAELVSPSTFYPGTFLLISGTLILVQLFFLAFGLLLSTILPKVKSVVTVTLPTVFGFFVIGTFGAVIGEDNIKYISPFKFYDSIYIINNNAYDLKFVLIEAVFVVVFIFASYKIYSKKDIHSIS